MYQKSIQNFILEYSDFDTNKLRLKNIQADFDVAWAIQQIEARKKIRDKLPTWASNMNIVLLLVIDTESEKSSDRDTIIHCIQINSFDNISDFTFGIKQEKGLPYSTFCKSIKKYLYEPNTSILKAGAYKSIAIEYNIEKLQTNSHLYTSDNYISNFPGRKFEIIETITFNSKNIKDIKTKYPQTNLSTRNFPLTTAELQKKLKTKDGGDLYLFATTLSNDNKVLIICKRATNA